MFGGNVIFMGEFKTCKFMFKKIVIFFLVFICIIILSGCKKADSNVTYNYGSSDSLTVYKELDKEFYMFRAGNKYYEFRRIDGYLTIEDMYDTENSDIPDMNDGDLMKVTADVDIYYGGISGSNHSIKINKLKSADLMDYNQIIDLLEIDDIADDISINRMNIIKMHRNEKNGDTYLIFPVTISSSFELRIYKQGEKSGTGMLYEKYEFDYEKNEGNLHLFLEDIRS